MDDSNYKSLNPNSRYIKGILYMKFLYVCLMGLMLSAQANTAQPSTVAGQVQRADGRPVAGAQVTLFDLADLHQGAVARAMTNAAGHFALSLQSFSAGTALPDGFALGQNYPNPFNPSTIIPYQIPASAHVRLEVFNMLGQRLATLVDAERPAGAHTAQWDGTDAAGRAVGAGVYIYRLSSGEVSVSRRMVLADGQAGMPAAGGAPGPVRAVEGLVEADGPVYGLTVSGEGLVPYVDPAFQVEAGRAWVEVVLAAPARAKRLPGEDRLLGDVDGKGRVDIVDALLVAASVGPTGLTTGGDLDGVENETRLDLIDLGDVNGDGVVNLVDAYLIGVYSVNPSDPVLPAGIGKRVSFASDGTPNPNKMYWTTSSGTNLDMGKIQRANLDGSNVEDLITHGLINPYALALDVGQGKMYWTDLNTGKHPAIQRANLDGSNVEDLITRSAGSHSPAGLALDVGRGKMYWTDLYYGTGKIQRANLDGSNVEDLITNGLGLPYGLALDVGREKMYWTDWITGKIQRANLDGSNVEDLITGLGRPAGLALDVGHGKMYWTDGQTSKIQRANLDGSNVEDLITRSAGLDNPAILALDVGHGKMYWTDGEANSGTGKIRRANLDGSNVEDLITNGLIWPGGIALVALAGSDVSGENGGSSRPDLVVESPSVSDNPLTTGQSFTLSATVRNRGNGQSASTTLRYYRSDDSTISTTDGQVGTDTVSGLSASATSAESINLTAPSSAGTYYYGACVESVSDESDTNNNCSTGVLVTVGSPDPIVELPNKIYWTDQDTGKIQRANLDGSNVEDLITGLVVPDGIALDGGRGKMYWTQWGMDTGKIQRANLDGSNVEDLITGLERPSGIALDVGRGKMYWTDAGTDKIQRANLDGSNVEDLITSGISPTRIALDVERGKMYWTQWGAPGKIQRANLDGSNVEDLITSAGELKGRGIALDGVNGKIYWSETPSLKVSSSRIRRANLDGSNVEDLITNGLEYPIAIALDVGRGKMYWADVLKSKIQRANLDGSNVEDRITHGFYYPLAIALVALADSAVSGGGSRPGPDLVVEKPSFSDDRLRTGQSFTLSATVRNLGNGRSASTTLRYYRSDDSTISPNDRHVGTGNVSGLSASATSAESINLTAPSSVGEYYYGACVESVTDESDTNNNCSIGVRVTVRSRPDLVVENPSVRDNSLTTGQSFTLSATVRNRGNVRSASTTLRYYRSDDSTISPNDRQVGTDTVRGLSASATASESIYLTAPSRAGTYYYGACVESVADESDTSNNCSTGVRVTVDSGGGGSSRPDLVVESPSVSDNTLTAGQSFTLRATVRNRGNGRSASTTLRYYRSSNSSISTNDRQVGTDNVRGLSASATASESIRLTAPSRAGTYYYGACVESVTDESDTNNNCSTGVRVTVRSGGGGDLDDHSDTRSGATDLSLGDARSGRIETGGDVDYFRVQVSSSGILTVYTTGDTDTYGTLQNSSGSDLEDDDDAGLSNNFRIERSVSEGTYYIRVRGYDSSTTGSYTVRTRFRNGGGGSSRPDLVVESPSVSDNSLTAGQSFTLRATVRNRGNGQSASTTLLYYYRSDDSSIVGTDTVSGLSASATSAESISLIAPSRAGTYYYGACVESVPDESDTNNNCSTEVLVTVSSDGGGSSRPDLVVESPSVSDNTLAAGQSFTLSATVHNRGNGRSASTTLRYYRSSNSSISTNDRQVGTDTVSGLSASATSAESISLIAPSRAGTYYYGACVESVPDESDTNNNCSTEVRVTVGSGGGGNDDHSNTRSGATNLPLDDSRSGRLETGGDVDYFQVQVSSSGTLTVYTTGSTDTWGTLQNSSGSDLANDDDGGDGNNFRIERTVTPGTYYLRVRGYDSSKTGSYTLHASFQSDDPDFNIELVFLNSVLTSSQSNSVKQIVRQAATRWESVITGDLPEVDHSSNPCDVDITELTKKYDNPPIRVDDVVDDLRIFVHVDSIDGSLGTLAQATPLELRDSLLLPAIAVIILDERDISSSFLQRIVLHEMAHALGFTGDVWNEKNLLRGLEWDWFFSSFSIDWDVRFIGRRAIGAFNNAGGRNYTANDKVPVENNTLLKDREWEPDLSREYSHWRESVFRKENKSELMVGRIYPDDELPLSAITIQSFADLGYQVDVSQADPYTLPSTPASKPVAGHSLELNCSLDVRGIRVVDENGRIVRIITPLWLRSLRE